MKIALPGIRDQQLFIFREATEEAIQTLRDNLAAPVFHEPLAVDSLGENAHLLRESEGWAAPTPDLVAAYFRQFQDHFPEYGTDKALAGLLGLSSDRRVREYKSGARTIPYGVWRKFLVITGRVPQEIIKVLAFMA